MPLNISVKLYIFIFLHQTTTILCERIMNIGCISLYSYIKPQLDVYRHLDISVVYLYIPTSNHNTSLHTLNLNWLYIFIFLHQTTTCLPSCSCFCWLYIFIFLHQTTTLLVMFLALMSCISLYSYIKPQLSISMMIL